MEGEEEQGKEKGRKWLKNEESDKSHS